MAGEPRPSLNLGQAATRGAIVLSAAGVAANIASFCSLLVLARLLSPQQFGQAALATAIAELILLLGAWSLPTALIREDPKTVEELFNAALALLLLIIPAMLAVGAAIGLLLNAFESRTIAVLFFAILAAGALSFVGNCFAAELERRFAYGRFSVIQLLGTSAAIAVSLGLAWAGAGVWALGGRYISLSVVATVASVLLSAWRPTRKVSLDRMRYLTRFGGMMVVSRLGDMLFHRYDNFVVGTVSGTYQLGLYNQAYVLAEAGNRVLMPVLAYVPLATYSRIQGDRSRTTRAFRIVTFFLSRTVTPLAVVFLVIPQELIGVLLGDNWKPAAWMLRGLSLYALLLPMFMHMRELLIANGAVRQVINARIVQLAFFLPGIVIAVWLWGGRGAAVVVAIGMVIGTAAMVSPIRRYVEVDMRDYVPPAVAGLAAAAAGLVAQRFVVGDTSTLLVVSATVVLVYSGLLMLIERSALRANLRFLIETIAGKRLFLAGGSK
jgi:O-antigen/teichoic acid export membrane protein